MEIGRSPLVIRRPPLLPSTHRLRCLTGRRRQGGRRTGSSLRRTARIASAGVGGQQGCCSSVWARGFVAQAPCRGARRRSAAPVGAAIGVLLLLSVPGRRRQRSRPRSAGNPNLASKCGINVMVVLDESGSIANTNGATIGVRRRSGVHHLPQGHRLPGRGDGVQQPVAEDLRLHDRHRRERRHSTTDASNIFARYLSHRTSASPPGDGYNPSEYSGTDQYTNWDDALQEVQDANTV